jgi:hypothetical protein
MGFEGIVSKRFDKPCRSGRSGDWIKTKNPDRPGDATGSRRAVVRAASATSTAWPGLARASPKETLGEIARSYNVSH